MRSIRTTKHVASCAGLTLALWGAALCISSGPAVAQQAGVRTGKHLKLLMSADDAVCMPLFTYLDGVFDPRNPDEMAQAPDGRWYQDGRQFLRYDSDPMFTRWKKSKNLSDGYPFHWGGEQAVYAEFDIDNDGEKELVVRNTSDHKEQWLTDFMWVVENRDSHWLTSKKRTAQEVRELADLKIRGPITNKGHPYFLLKHPDFQAQRGPYNPYFQHWGFINPFALQNQTYLLFFQSNHTLTTSGVVWGLVQHVRPDHTAEEVCYIDLLNKHD